MRAIAKYAAAVLVALPVAAGATTWQVSGIFDDGTTLTGRFAINVYGYLSSAKLTTQAAGVFTGAVYGSPGDSFGNYPGGLTISQNSYQDELNLVFASDITTATSSVALLSASYECRGSGYCYNATAGNIRYLVSGIASVPEPETWVLMIGGFGMAGAMLRRGRAIAA